MKNLNLELKEEGTNQIAEQYIQLNDFVLNNWDLLFKGATRMNLHLYEDSCEGVYDAPERIQIDEVRLHAWAGVKIINQWHCNHNDIEELTEEDVVYAYEQVQKLIDSASKAIYMEKVSLELKEEGNSKIIDEYNKLNDFVEENWKLLLIGAKKSNSWIPRDSYAPDRIKFNRIYLHSYQGIKRIWEESDDNWGEYEWHLRDSLEALKEEHILLMAKELQELINIASEEVECGFEITIKKK